MPRTVGCADMGEAGGRAVGLWMVVHGCLFPCAVVFRMGLARDRGVAYAWSVSAWMTVVACSRTSLFAGWTACCAAC